MPAADTVESKRPFFSVVVPAYNRASLLPKLLNNVQAQIFQDFELILVDDGSTDNTEAQFKSIKDSRFKYFAKENGERGAARNFGAAKATGDYVFFLDSDDSIEPEFLSEAKIGIEKYNSPEWFHIRFDTVDEKGNRLYVKPSLDGGINDRLLNRNYLASAVFLRMDIALKFQFSEDRTFVFGEDWYLWLRLSRRYPLRFSNKILYHQTRESFREELNFSDTRVLEQNMHLMLKLLKEDCETNQDYVLKRVEAQYQSLIALDKVLLGQNKEALTLLLRAISLNPIHLVWRKSYAILKKGLL